MYSQNAIESLTGRVGWKQHPASFPFVLSVENTTSDSERFFQDFSALVTLQNIRSVMEDEEADEAAFNEFLSDLQRKSIASVLSGILRESGTLQNLDTLVEDNKTIFDEAIGLQVAISVIEMMYSSTRSNFRERVTKELSSLLFQELNGAHADNGVAVSTGLKNMIQREIITLVKRLFPKPKPAISTPKFA